MLFFVRIDNSFKYPEDSTPIEYIKNDKIQKLIQKEQSK